MEIRDFFTFKEFVTPKLITVVYWIGLFFIAAWALSTANGNGFLGWLQGGYGEDISIGRIVYGALYGVIGALFWRVWCEIWVVIFSINDRLGVLVEFGNKGSIDSGRNLRS